MTQNNRERLRAQEAAKAKQQRLNRIIGVAAAVLAVVLIGVLVTVVIQQSQLNAANSATTPPNATADGKAIVVNPGKAVAGAPVVELFFDYQCPVCQQFEGIFGEELKKLAETGEIALHYRTMSFLDTNLHNDASLRAGIGAACADVAGAYSAYHDQVFVNQPETEGDGFDDVVLRDAIPETVGITGEKLTGFQSCYDQQTTKAFVQKSNELGQQDLLAITQTVGTPTLLVNGHSISLETLSQTAPADLAELIRKNA